jgi:predicted metal-dependent hydrolase
MTTRRSLRTWDEVSEELSNRRIPKRWIAEYAGVREQALSVASSVVNMKRQVTLPNPELMWEAIDAIEAGWRPERLS